MLSDFAFILIPSFVFVIATLIKLIIHWRKHGFDINYSLAYGHMPSGHTAFVTSLATTIGILEGWHSPIFGLAFCFAVLVILDALRLRVWMGEHAMYINRLIAKLNLDETEFPHLKERIGHKPEEVVVGALLGISVAPLLLWILLQ
ncbi:MAG: divergent PAP2 family protein [Candidatus Moraniibacteriota bacterium]